MNNSIIVPKFYKPWPHQAAAWQRRQTGKYHYYFKLWSRQTGKDADDIQYTDNRAWENPGMQAAYIGLDNVWINNNIFKKYIDGRTFWDDYPEEYIHPKDTPKEVYFSNNPEGTAQSRIKFIGFLNDQQLIGSSYDHFIISEASLYKENAFSFIQPIWDQKLAMGKDLFVGFNGTPRGVRNVFYELLRTYSGVDDPDDFNGEHGDCYIDVVKIQDVTIPDGNGGYRRLYSDEDLEKLKDRYLRQFGNLNLYKQEFECCFTTVNAGLVYLGIERLMDEKRFCRFNIDTSKPLYAAFDISSKGKMTDATAAIIFQMVGNRMFIYDIYETRGKSLIECLAELSMKGWFKYLKFVALPWDSTRSASSETPIEEARKMYPQITWHALGKERVDRGIQQVRTQLPNMFINSDNCDYLIDCFMNYEYKRLEKQDDWAAKPSHNKYSHLMDALRYAVMAVNEMEYLGLDIVGNYNPKMEFYESMYTDEIAEEEKPNTFYKVKKRRNDGTTYQGMGSGQPNGYTRGW